MVASQESCVQRREQAERFVAALTGDVGTPLTFQTFPDGEGDSGAPPCIIHATLGEAWERLLDLQEHGHGVFVQINEGDGQGRSAANVVSLRALFADNDRFDYTPPRLKTPNIVVSSGHGWHYYLLLKPGEPLAEFTAAQRAIAAKLGTDAKVCDLARVLRLPGTYNLKDRSKPVLVEMIHCDPEPRRTITGALAFCGVTQAELNAARPSAPLPGRRLLVSNAVERAEAYVSTIRAVQGDGGDQATFRVAAALVKDFALSREDAWDVFRRWNVLYATPPWDELELGKKLQNAFRHGKAPIGGKLAEEMEQAQDANADDAAAKQIAATANPQLDPENWVCDLSRPQPWRYWRANAWQEGIAERALERLLTNEAKLGKRAVEAWKKRCAVVDRAEPVYSSRERVTVLPDGTKVANTFRSPTLTPAYSMNPRAVLDWEPIELVLRNLVDGDEAALRWVIGWLAKLAQNAHRGVPRRIGTALVFHGARGAGKGVLECLLRALLGEWNVASVAQGDLDSAHWAWIVGKLCVVADEVFTSENRSAAQVAKMKNAITAHARLVNPKGKDQVERPAVENWIFFANGHRPVEIEKGDRRFTVFRTGGPIGPELGALVADDARAGGPLVRAFLAYLLAVPREQLADDYVPLHTAAKENVSRASGNSATKFSAEVSARGFWSTTGALAAHGMALGPADLYLPGAHGFRQIEGVAGPVLLNRRLMDVYRAYAQEINAPAQQETTLLAALREEIPACFEAELLVDGRRERVVAGLPGMFPAAMTIACAAPEPALPQQQTLTLGA